MHEYSLAVSLLERIEREARARRATAVHAVHVRLGDLSGTDRELLATAYDVLRADTACARAPLHVERVAARWVCRACDGPVEAGGVLRCRACGAPARLAEGDELVLARIEMEVEDV